MTHRPFQLEIKGKRIRSYSTLDNAMIGAIRVARENLRCMEVLVVYHKDTGMELGTVRINAVGKMLASWIWEN